MHDPLDQLLGAGLFAVSPFAVFYADEARPYAMMTCHRHRATGVLMVSQPGNHRDVTLICFSRAPIDRLISYKERMGWQFPYVSSYGTEFPFDFGLAPHARAGAGDPRGQGDDRQPTRVAPGLGRQVGAKLEDGLREGPCFIAFARENGSVYHTYTVMAPDPFVAPYNSFLLERTPKPEPEEPRAWRKDEYPD